MDNTQVFSISAKDLFQFIDECSFFKTIEGIKMIHKGKVLGNGRQRSGWDFGHVFYPQNAKNRNGYNGSTCFRKLNQYFVGAAIYQAPHVLKVSGVG
jgi:hypothetical protein